MNIYCDRTLPNFCFNTFISCNKNLEIYQAKNTVQYEQITQEAKNAIAQHNEDSQFLGHVREIIRFVKTA